MTPEDPHSDLSAALRRGADQARASKGARRGGLARILRTVFYALLIAFVIGLLIGTLIRRQIEKPVRYIGALPASVHEPLQERMVS